MQKISYLILIAFFFILDQLSKWWVTEQFIRARFADVVGEPLGLLEWYANTADPLGFVSIKILSFFNIVMVWNPGISFGLFDNGYDWAPIALSVMSMVIAGVFGVWLYRSASKLQSIAIALVIAGAIGNVVDRLRFGAVIDFIDIHVAGYHWPAFNVADSCVCVGVFLLIVHSFFFESAEKNATQNV